MLCTIGDNLMPLHNSCIFVSEGTVRSCMFAVQSYLSNHLDPMYDVLPDSVVSAARGTVSLVPDFYRRLDCSLLVDVEHESWPEFFPAWRTIFGWTGFDDDVGVEWAYSPEICCLLSFNCVGLLRLAYSLFWRLSNVAIRKNSNLRVLGFRLPCCPEFIDFDAGIVLLWMARSRKMNNCNRWRVVLLWSSRMQKKNKCTILVLIWTESVLSVHFWFCLMKFPAFSFLLLLWYPNYSV